MMVAEWLRYGPIAEVYARVSEPAYFAAPASDLVSLLELAPATRLLEVGCGTGAVSRAAARSLGSDGLLVSSDLSLGMVEACRKRVASSRPLACSVSSLSFAPGSFDAVAAAFVLTHVSDVDAALREIIAVLRPTGRVAVSSWVTSPASTPPGRVWQRHLEKRCRAPELEAAGRMALPSESALASATALAEALGRAGLAVRKVEKRTYELSLAARDYVESRAVSVSARFLRSRLSSAEWETLVAEASDELSRRFGSEVSFDLCACLALATVKRPDGSG